MKEIVEKIIELSKKHAADDANLSVEIRTLLRNATVSNSALIQEWVNDDEYEPEQEFDFITDRYYLIPKSSL